MEFHPIGHGSSFDDDIVPIELFIQHSKNPEDYENNIKLYHYYTLNAYVYKDHAKKFLEKNPVDEFGLEYIDEKFNYFIQKIGKEFKQNRLIDINNVTRLFGFFGLILCGKTYSYGNSKINIEGLISNDNLKNYYILCNEKGVFGINSYLYAVFNKIYVLGLPTQDTYADNSLMCPFHFYQHDITHSGDVEGTSERKLNFMENIYYKILEDENTDYKFKEFLLCIVFIYMHEYTSEFESNINNDYTTYILEKIQDKDLASSTLIASKFLDDYKYLIDPKVENSFFDMIESRNKNVLNKYEKPDDPERSVNNVEFFILLYVGLKFILENYFDESYTYDENDMKNLVQGIGNISFDDYDPNYDSDYINYYDSE